MKKVGEYTPGISNDDYHNDTEFLSSSQLKKAIDSHSNFRYEMNKGHEPAKWSPDNAMDFGTYIHALLDKTADVENEFAFIDMDGLNLRTKADREYKAKFLDNAQGKIVLPAHDKLRAQQCIKSVNAHPFFKKMVDMEGIEEHSGYYIDDFNKLNLRFRPDKRVNSLIDGKPAIIDWKSIYNIDEFHKSAKWDRHYDLSAAMYLEGDKYITGEDDVDFIFGVIESRPPFRVAVYKCSESFLQYGAKKLAKAKSNVKLAYKIETPTIRFQETDYQEI